jgi:hypothetical protein
MAAALLPEPLWDLVEPFFPIPPVPTKNSISSNSGVREGRMKTRARRGSVELNGVDGELPIVPQKTPEPPVIAVIHRAPNHPGQFPVTDDETRWRSIGRHSRDGLGPGLEPTSHTRHAAIGV